MTFQKKDAHVSSLLHTEVVLSVSELTSLRITTQLTHFLRLSVVVALSDTFVLKRGLNEDGTGGTKLVSP